METGTSNPAGRVPEVSPVRRVRRGLAFGLAGTLVTVAALTGCGGASNPSGFAWLSPGESHRGWHVVRIPNGAELLYPPHWHQLHGDRGTATAALIDQGGRFLGYLNVTPRQGGETQSNWASFRTSHNADEGDRDVKRLAVASGLQFSSGRGTCVKDSYTTRTGAHFVEIACLVKGARTSSVIVGAAPPGSPQIGVVERAISGFRA